MIDSRLIPCIYFTNEECGRLGSFFFRYKYSAIWLSILMMIYLLIVKLMLKFIFRIFVKERDIKKPKRFKIRIS